MKPIILISILNKYLDILTNLDNRTPLRGSECTKRSTHDNKIRYQNAAKA